MSDEQRTYKQPVNLTRPDGCEHAWRTNKLYVITRRCRAYRETPESEPKDVFVVETAFMDPDFAALYAAKMQHPDAYTDETKWFYTIHECKVESR